MATSVQVPTKLSAPKKTATETEDRAAGDQKRRPSSSSAKQPHTRPKTLNMSHHETKQQTEMLRERLGDVESRKDTQQRADKMQQQPQASPVYSQVVTTRLNRCDESEGEMRRIDALLNTLEDKLVSKHTCRLSHKKRCSMVLVDWFSFIPLTTCQ
ncbi:unnamed protein product [Dibothriocephalus latus]|uniref:Uncharacterized protein n=1 Tax=Dibothriocephalus latus TaxID=60516 RepID=A0A3P7MJI8_DIBLA|nr:unnamed protein product [Dibothriocephalus latus]